MSKHGKGKVPPTLEAPQEEQQQEQVFIKTPVEILFHIAGTNIEKNPLTGVVEFTLLSPTGIGVTVLLSDDNVKELIENLQQTISTVDVFKSMPAGLAT